MIVMRIGKLPGNCEIIGYEKGGWFPIDGFNFGFGVSMEELEAAIKKDREGKKKKKKEKGGSQGTKPSAVQTAKKKKKTEGEGDDDGITKLQFSKAVDGSTVYLMRHAMELLPTGTSTNLDAEIHVIGSMSNEAKTVYCQLRVYLEDVFITSWEVSGSGDGRPTENVELQYGKKAMCFQGSQGSFLDPAQEDGWSMWKNERWRHYQDLVQTL
jgi:type VI protein secretion system component Hcp